MSEEKSILIVEDDKTFRTVMESALKKEGYRVISADNGTEGEQKIRELQPDLVLLDVMMPGKNGLDICLAIKGDERLKETPVMMLTCITEMSEKDDSYWREQTGADDFMTKPFPIGEFLRRVKLLVGE
jgi:DNA-binding response OmpR family regulator